MAGWRLQSWLLRNSLKEEDAVEVALNNHKTTPIQRGRHMVFQHCSSDPATHPFAGLSRTVNMWATKKLFVKCSKITAKPQTNFASLLKAKKAHDEEERLRLQAVRTHKKGKGSKKASKKGNGRKGSLPSSPSKDVAEGSQSPPGKPGKQEEEDEDKDEEGESKTGYNEFEREARTVNLGKPIAYPTSSQPLIDVLSVNMQHDPQFGTYMMEQFKSMGNLPKLGYRVRCPWDHNNLPGRILGRRDPSTAWRRTLASSSR